MPRLSSITLALTALYCRFHAAFAYSLLRFVSPLFSLSLMPQIFFHAMPFAAFRMLPFHFSMPIFYFHGSHCHCATRQLSPSRFAIAAFRRFSPYDAAAMPPPVIAAYSADSAQRHFMIFAGAAARRRAAATPAAAQVASRSRVTRRRWQARSVAGGKMIAMLLQPQPTRMPRQRNTLRRAVPPRDTYAAMPIHFPLSPSDASRSMIFHHTPFCAPAPPPIAVFAASFDTPAAFADDLSHFHCHAAFIY